MEVKRIKDILIVVLLGCAIGLTLRLYSLASELQGDLRASEQIVAQDHIQLSQSLTEKNRQVSKLLNTVRGTFGQIEIAAHSQRQYWDKTGAETVKLVHDADQTVLRLNGTNELLQQDLERVTDSSTAALDTFPPFMEEAKQDMADFDAAIKNPDIAGSLAETHGILAEGHHIMKQGSKKVDTLVAPPTKMDAVKDWLVFAARMFYFSKP